MQAYYRDDMYPAFQNCLGRIGKETHKPGNGFSQFRVLGSVASGNRRFNLRSVLQDGGGVHAGPALEQRAAPKGR
ncbi:hypothetical protein RvVAR031_41670 [Agrobacterium vitis]|nr:hypothetical protein RvVAR031_41670 [Agrobacterium vitis]